MRTSELSKRYGKALFELGQEKNKVDLFGAEISELATAVNSEMNVSQFASTPLIRTSDKEEAFKSALGGMKLSEEVMSFCLLLAKKGRLGLLQEIATSYQDELDQSKGVTRGTIKTARDLSDADKKEIISLLKQITGKEVEAEFQKDESLVAGVQAQIGSLTIDDSIQGHMNRMRDELNRRVH